MRKVIIAIVLVFGSMSGYQYYCDWQFAQLEEALTDLDLKENMTLGDLRQALGKPSKTENGYSWAGGTVEVYSESADDAAEPYTIKVSADYPGLVRGRPMEVYTRLAGIVAQGVNWMDVSRAQNQAHWIVAWRMDKENKEVLSLSMMRMIINSQQRFFREKCPRGFERFVEVSIMRPDIR